MLHFRELATNIKTEDASFSFTQFFLILLWPLYRTFNHILINLGRKISADRSLWTDFLDILQSLAKF